MFSLNGYREAFFSKVLEKFMAKKDLINDGVENDENQEFGVTFSLPFIGKPSLEFKKDFCKLIEDKFGIKPFTSFTSCKVGQFFSLKSRAPPSLAANVVYRFKCSRDSDISYIGRTERHLLTRVEEHMDIEKASAVSSHLQQCTSCQDNANFDNFEILRRCRDRTIYQHEAFLIRKYQPILNSQLHNKGGALLRIF